ncbi:MAG: type II toxin-antitoxin system RelE/ParE family toxin [Xanthobacteraceae bacterium]
MGERRRPVIWSSDARSDLSEIWNYYVKVAGRHTADGIARKIGDACRLVEEHPFAGRARNEVRPSLRSITASQHVVFYRVNNDVVEIVRVLDGRRDLDEIFSGDA